MSVTEASGIRSWLDTSTHAGRQKTLRLLVKVIAALWVAAVAAEFVWSLPEPIETAVNQQWESMTARRFATIAIVLLVISVSSLYGMYRTWRFQSNGPFFVAIGQLCPPAWHFVSASTAVAAYFWHLAAFCVGMLLFLSWTQPELFDPAPDRTQPSSGGDA